MNKIHCLFLSLCLCMTVATPVHAETVAAAYDAITTPNVAVKLNAKFERNWGRFIRPDIEDTKVIFSVNNKAIGTAQTDNDGIASLAYVGSATGTFQWSAQMPKHKVTVTGIIRIIPTTKKAIVFDIDSTLSNLSEVLVPVKGHKAPCYPHSPQFVKRLAKQYEIIYLTARDDTFLSETMAFLRRHRFPAGTVIHNEVSRNGKHGNQLWPKNHGKFKAAVIQEIQGRKIQFLAGVGNAETDAEAYKKAKIPGFIRGSAYQGITKFDSYKELEALFVKKKWLSLKQQPK